jgi:hypothetical protein
MTGASTSDTNPIRVRHGPPFAPPPHGRMKKGLRKMLPESFASKEYRRWDLNPHEVALTGF